MNAEALRLERLRSAFQARKDYRRIVGVWPEEMDYLRAYPDHERSGRIEARVRPFPKGAN